MAIRVWSLDHRSSEESVARRAARDRRLSEAAVVAAYGEGPRLDTRRRKQICKTKKKQTVVNAGCRSFKAGCAVCVPFELKGLIKLSALISKAARLLVGW